MKWQLKFLSGYLGLLLLLAFLLLGFATARPQDLLILSRDQILRQKLTEARTLLLIWPQSIKQRNFDLDQKEAELNEIEARLIEREKASESKETSLTERENRLLQSERDSQATSELIKKLTSSLEIASTSWKKERAKLNLELWLWRIGAPLAVGGLIYALAK